MKRILIAEDERIFRTMLSDFIEQFDYEVVSAEDGAVAWNLFNEMDIDLVITDINMPNMNGIELLKRIKGVNPKLPIIVITGVSLESAQTSARDYGANDLLIKPFKMKDLLVVVNDLLK